MFEPAVLQRSHDLTKMSQLWNKQMSNQVQEMYVPGSQNGFSVLNGGTAEENPSTIQGRVPGWKQVGQTFVASDSKVDTQDFDKLVSTALHQGIVSNPFRNGDGIEAEDVQKSLHYDHLPKAMFTDAHNNVWSSQCDTMQW